MCCVQAKPADTSGERGAHKKFHVLVTTNANIYQAWQIRVMHFWYNKMKKQCEAEDPDGCQMGGFTRVLHDKADKLVDEIPTCVVDRWVSLHLCMVHLFILDD